MGDGEEEEAGVINFGMRIAECGITYIVFRTPLGWVGAAGTEQGICRIVLPQKAKQAVVRELEIEAQGSELSRPAASRILAKAVKLLQQYFSAERVSFDLPLDLRYYTPFQQAVWQAAAEIPFGMTRSYAWIAKRIGNPKAVRAVGQALGANPVPVMVPCHRVISSSGTMGGFSGGPGMKKKLLDLEAHAKVPHVNVLC